MDNRHGYLLGPFTEHECLGVIECGVWKEGLQPSEEGVDAVTQGLKGLGWGEAHGGEKASKLEAGLGSHPRNPGVAHLGSGWFAAVSGGLVRSRESSKGVQGPCWTPPPPLPSPHSWL